MEGLGAAFVAAAAAGALAFAGTGALVRVLARRGILDHPNDRSSHERPTPRGGGIAVIAALVATWGGAAAWAASGGAALPPGLPVVLAAAVVLALVSWADDRRGLPAGLRLAVHVVAVGVAIPAMAGSALFFQGLLPEALDRAAAAFLWLWFLNLYNFMDGIDGLAGAETAALGIGVAAVVAAGGLPPLPAALALSATGAALGFLRWNWPPARIFLGDVGSVPLGYLLGWLLLTLAAAGAWRAALILPLYYLADATVTLARRLVRGEAVWRAHREHFYQLAVRAGMAHGAVVRRVIAVNAGLVVLAVAAERGLGWVAGALAGLLVGGLLEALSRPLRGRR